MLYVDGPLKTPIQTLSSSFSFNIVILRLQYRHFIGYKKTCRDNGSKTFAGYLRPEKCGNIDLEFLELSSQSRRFRR